MRNNFLFLPILALLISCSSGGSNEEAGLGKISFKLDTVMIDAGDHFFFVQYGLSMSALDREKKQLLNYNPDKFEVEVIDLVSRQLKKVKTYEKEGPNGIGGGFVMKLQALPDERLIFYDYLGLHFLDPTGEKLNMVRFEDAKFSGDSLLGDEDIFVRSLVTNDGKVFCGFYGTQTFGGRTKGFAVVDVENNRLKLIPSDVLDFTADLSIDYEVSPGTGSQFPEQNYVHFDGDQMIISTSAKNQLWIYDTKSDTLTTKIYESQLTANGKKGAFPRKVSSQQEWVNALKEKRKEVSFENLIYDEGEGRYWRISTEMDRLTASDSVVMKTVLTAFDQELNQLGETRLPENFRASRILFALDGYLWQFLNIEDEVAFVRIKPTLEYD